MAGKYLKQLLEKARAVMRLNEPSDCFLQLRENLRDDYCWEAMSVELTAEKMKKIDEGHDEVYDFKQVKTIGYGQTPEEALNELIGKLSNLQFKKNMYQNDKLWVEICASPPMAHTSTPKIELPALRKILEKYKILGDEKDGM